MTSSSPKVNRASNQSLPTDNTAHISPVSSPHVRQRKLVVHSPHDSEFCMFDAGSQPNNQSLHIDSDGFQLSSREKRNTRRKEIHHCRVVYGTANYTSWEKSPGKHKPTSPNCDFFISHANILYIPHHTLVGKVKHHLKGKGLDIDGIQIDVASNSLTKVISSALIAMEDELLSPDMWC